MEHPTIRKRDVKEVNMFWGLDISEILTASLLKGSTIYDPSFATDVRQSIEKCAQNLLV